MTTTQKVTVLAVVLSLAGCATPQVVPLGNNTFSLSKLSPHCAAGTAGAVKADVYFQAEQFCREQHQRLEIVDFEGKSGIPFVRCANAELTFRCTDKETSDGMP